MIAVHRERVFQQNLFFATCDHCGKWVKSGVGQFVWESRRQAKINAERHRCAS